MRSSWWVWRRARSITGCRRYNAPRAVNIHAAACFHHRGIFIRELRFAVARVEDLLEQLQAAGERDSDDIFQECAAPLQFRFDRVFFRFLGGDDCSDVFHEVDSAFLAVHASALLIAAGRAVETHRHMATLAEARNFAHGGATFRAGNCCLGGRRRSGIPSVWRILCVCSNVALRRCDLRFGLWCRRFDCSGVGGARLNRRQLKCRARFHFRHSIRRFVAVLARR